MLFYFQTPRQPECQSPKVSETPTNYDRWVVVTVAAAVVVVIVVVMVAVVVAVVVGLAVMAVVVPQTADGVEVSLCCGPEG